VLGVGGGGDAWELALTPRQGDGIGVNDCRALREGCESDSRPKAGAFRHFSELIIAGTATGGGHELEGRRADEPCGDTPYLVSVLELGDTHAKPGTGSVSGGNGSAHMGVETD
jgi:hypothetical protein